MLYQGHFILQMDVKELCLSFGQVAKFKSYSHHPGIGDVTEADHELTQWTASKITRKKKTASCTNLCCRGLSKCYVWLKMNMSAAMSNCFHL